jgi:UPF0755 protein
VLLLLVLALGGCRGEGSGEVIPIHVRPGASFNEITDSLAANDIVHNPLLFRIYARVTRSDRAAQAGTYGFRPGDGWRTILDDLRLGRVMTARFVVPEGWEVRRMAPRLASLLRLPEDSVLAVLTDPATAERLGVPGPTVEGYLFPATYTVPFDIPLDSLLALMVAEYRARWTPERQALADSLGLSEQEVVTLASIVEREARVRDEMPLMSAVFHRRLRIGYPLQADATVQYALGEHQARLLYSHISSVADDPYNTYHHRGLPPGPIGAPSEAAIDAALNPADVDYLYFVARPDGTHIFTRTLVEHNRARQTVRREREAREREQTEDRPAANAAGTSPER